MPFMPEQAHMRLGEAFYDLVKPASFPRHTLRYRNQRAAAEVGLEGLDDKAWVEHFGGFKPLPGSFDAPLALRYHGHQFRVYNPDLGDGRGFLFAQCRSLDDGRLLDLGTKGSGTTPYSRSGDGRLTLKGGVREALATARLEALGVNTSRSFSLIETGEELVRHDEPSPTRSAVLVRLSHSHIRIGTFQRLAYEGDQEALAGLIDYSLSEYYPASASEVSGTTQQVARLFAHVVAETARLAAEWMVAGFVHGVLNTDNLNITGESFDYGPYRFLPVYEPGFTAAYFDETGLYAYGRQPQAVHWNLCRLAECLLPFVERDELARLLTLFDPVFAETLYDRFCRRLGLKPPDASGTALAGELVGAAFRFMQETRLPPDHFFHDWLGGELSLARAMGGPRGDAYKGSSFAELAVLLPQFEAHAEAAAVLEKPLLQAEQPVTLVYEEIENLWAAIDRNDDWQAFQTMLERHEEMRATMAPLLGKRRWPWPLPDVCVSPLV
jgi:serine/tyrosine/threonine adenylyltransferase